ncbi:MAG: hypothetical protein IT168_32285 [Bryobacterales bacterium]|nr:hypothetical protein [Bryobacterales bacterium]
MSHRLAALTVAALPLLGETYRFSSNDLIVDMSVKHQRRYTGSPLTLYDANNRLIPACGSSNPRDGSCPESFVGTAAFVEFSVHGPDGKPARKAAVREVVTLVAQSDGLPERKQFVQTVPLVNGIASDVQIFGYDEKPIPKEDRLLQRDRSKASFRRFRQELFLDGDPEPFAILEWTHRTTDIRMSVLKATAANRRR